MVDALASTPTMVINVKIVAEPPCYTIGLT